MTGVQYVADLIEGAWTPDRPGRAKDVPQPVIHTESDQQNVDTKRNDSCYVKDGGGQEVEPASFGWQEERRTTRVEVDLVASDKRVQGDKVDGRVRLLGYRNTGDSTDEFGLEPGEPEDNGGLVGEVRLILTNVRRGDREFDRIEVTGVNDVSGTMGANKYRAQVTVELVEIARSL